MSLYSWILYSEIRLFFEFRNFFFQIRTKNLSSVLSVRFTQLCELYDRLNLNNTSMNHASFIVSRLKALSATPLAGGIKISNILRHRSEISDLTAWFLQINHCKPARVVLRNYILYSFSAWISFNTSIIIIFLSQTCRTCNKTTQRGSRWFA